MDILDMILGAEMANEYTDSQQLAHEEKTVITWDGNTEGKEILPILNEDNNVFYLVSNKPVDLNNVKKLSWFIESSHIEESIDLSNTVVASEEPLHFFASADGIPLVVVCDTDFEIEGVAIKKGTYFTKGTVEPFVYVNYIERETVHQIDPKFIPGLIPVLNLTTGFDLSGIGLECTAEENAVIQMAADNKMPIVVQFSVQGVYVSALFAFSYVEGMSTFDAIASGMTFSINNATGVWQTLMSGRSE